MTTWQTELMEENARNAQWEELNAPDPCEGMMYDASQSIKVAVHHLDKAMDWVYTAVDELGTTPMSYKVESFIDEISDLINGLKKLQEQYERGER